MKELSTKTTHASGKAIKHDWFVLDASGRILGDVATKAAHILRGKHKANFSPHLDLGDYVVIVNAEKVKVSGKKLTDKIYWSHSGFVGNIKGVPFQEMLAKQPERVLELAIKGMIKNHVLGRAQLKKLKVYAGGEHPHAAHKPQPLSF
ncbi:MAG: 50S ribosomal protein L13 [Spirochaetes bacterium]|nr:50S ribosomal protein L13 [Spirochaetota bacterium]